ncbi:hypothetical protein [Kineococcus rhizosphaerae]|uniref:Uncharacterized protein n=1 Tax=Kineococcus rhizosphaerae TaxID=559628 RepID=A0A2T0R060_9ACTN|nr:hypothetical protein [Kineococcus rhizosphaerae]PRY12495.1 hypothetical protein CLV37_11055 [Kineococcus rhizosphaerae]
MSLEDAASWATIAGGIAVLAAFLRGCALVAMKYHAREVRRWERTEQGLDSGRLRWWNWVRARWRLLWATGRLRTRREERG